MAPPRGVRQRQWEEEMLGEYLATQWREHRVIARVRLGPHEAQLDAALDPAERRLVGAAFRRWADAVIVDPPALWIVEAALIPDPGDISRVMTYQKLLPHTPELDEFRGFAVRGLLVWAVDDPYSRAVAVEHGFRVDIFRPSHFLQWISTKRRREQRAPTPSQVLLT